MFIRFVMYLIFTNIKIYLRKYMRKLYNLVDNYSDFNNILIEKKYQLCCKIFVFFKKKLSIYVGFMKEHKAVYIKFYNNFILIHVRKLRFNFKTMRAASIYWLIPYYFYLISITPLYTYKDYLNLKKY